MRSYGFCNSPLYYNNSYTGYSLVPNQDVKRFGNHYKTNEYSMRSEPLSDNEKRLLLVGDSVLNGGVQTDQTELASTILENEMQNLQGSSATPRVLNISCGGWGIDNAAGVIEEYGDFDAKEIILVLNSHDAVGTKSSTEVAGNSVHFPSKQYKLAWIELFDRYLIPRIQSKLNIISDSSKINSTNTSQGKENSKGWMFFKEYCEDKNIRLAIYLHATQGEIAEGEYDENGKWITSFAEDNSIPIFFDINELTKDDFRDDIHLNAKGQKVMVGILYPEVETYFESKK